MNREDHGRQTLSRQRTVIDASQRLETRAVARPLARPDEAKLAAEQPDASPLPAETALRIILHLLALFAVAAFLLFYCVVPTVRDILL